MGLVYRPRRRHRDRAIRQLKQSRDRKEAIRLGRKERPNLRSLTVAALKNRLFWRVRGRSSASAFIVERLFLSPNRPPAR